MKTLCLILLTIVGFLIFQSEASIPPVCDVYNLSLALCNTEIHCVKHMFLDENVGDNITFNFLVNRVITNYHVNDYIDDIICNSTEGQAMWMVILKNFNFCNHVNEYYSAHLQACVCRADKVCNHKSLKNSLFIFSDTQIFIWAIVVVLTMVVIASFQEISQLNKIANDLLAIFNLKKSTAAAGSV